MAGMAALEGCMVDEDTSPHSSELASGTSALTPASSLQARTTAPIVNSFARSYAADAKASPTEVTSILEQRIRGVQEEAGLAETGRVLSVGYGRTTSRITKHDID